MGKGEAGVSVPATQHPLLTRPAPPLYSLPMLRKLTARQQRFVELYPLLLNATEAARQAGYAGESHTLEVAGFDNLRKPAIARAIQERIAATSLRTQITEDYVLAGLRDNAEHFRQRGDGAASTRALELLGKHLGMFVERSIAVSVDGGKAPPRYILALTGETPPTEEPPGAPES